MNRGPIRKINIRIDVWTIHAWTNRRDRSDLKLLKLDDINALQQCNFVYKCVNDQQVPQQLRNFFNFNQNVHEHNTRSSGLLHIPRHRKHLFQHSIRYTGTRHWNNLPKSLKKLSKLKCFSYKVKAFEMLSSITTSPCFCHIYTDILTL